MRHQVLFYTFRAMSWVMPMQTTDADFQAQFLQKDAVLPPLGNILGDVTPHTEQLWKIWTPEATFCEIGPFEIMAHVTGKNNPSFLDFLHI